MAKVLELQLQHQSFQRILGLISFRIYWVDLLAVQGTLKNLLQHHSSKASILRHSFFFMVPLSPLYMTIGKTIALTIWTFVGKVMSLLFNMLSRFVIAFFPKSKHLLISWLQSPSAVILEPKKIKSRGGNGKPLQYSCNENTMNSIKNSMNCWCKTLQFYIPCFSKYRSIWWCRGAMLSQSQLSWRTTCKHSQLNMNKK